MKKVTKAVIPAAGFGTRFLPATKAQPKEMLPIIDKPTIQYIVEEAVASGITDILIVTSPYKKSIEDHFDKSFELESLLAKNGKVEEHKMLGNISEMVNIYYVRQKEAKGLGHAISKAEAFVGDEPFAILLGDDIVVNYDGKPATKQLIDEYEKHNASIVGVQEVDLKDVFKYGIIKPSDMKCSDTRLVKVSDMVEKPKPEEAPSKFAVLGRYLLTPKIFEFLKTQEAGVGGEIQLTDAIKRLALSESVYGYDFVGKRYDVGNKFGFIQATIDFALDREDLKGEVLEYLKDKVK